MILTIRRRLPTSTSTLTGVVGVEDAVGAVVADGTTPIDFKRLDLQFCSTRIVRSSMRGVRGG